MEKKTLDERYSDELLTDNTRLAKYEQCRDCIYRDDGTPFSNRYDKGCCQKFPHPSSKPMGVMKNTLECRFRRTEDKK